MTMKSLYRVIAAVLCAALCLGLVACQGHNITFDAPWEDTPPLPAAAPEHEVTPYSSLAYQSFDGAAFMQAVEEATALLEEPDSEKQVLEAYNTLAMELRDCLTMYTLADITSYRDYSDEAQMEEASDAYMTATDCSDAFSSFLSAMLDSDYRDAYIKEVGRDNALQYEDYDAMTDEQREMLERREDLIDQYTLLAGGEFDSYQELAEGAAPIYVELIKLNKQIAASDGYDDFATYAYDGFLRGYSPEDARKLEDIVKGDLSMLYLAFLFKQIGNGTDSLLYEYSDSSEDNLIGLMRQYIPATDPALSDSLQYMLDCGAYDIAYDEDKVDVSFTTILADYNMPVLFSKPTPDSQVLSLDTLVHEFGHYNSYYNDPVYARADGYLYTLEDLDVAEIPSTALELLFLRHFDELYGQDADALRMVLLCNILENVIMGCMMDEFQQEVYAAEDLQPEDVHRIFHDVMVQYMGDDTFIDDYAWYMWALVNHNFENPFYYISYAMSALAAFQLWELGEEDPDAAMEKYLQLVSYGCSVDFQGLLEVCELRDVMDEEYLSDLYDRLYEVYEQVE